MRRRRDNASSASRTASRPSVAVWAVAAAVSVAVASVTGCGGGDPEVAPPAVDAAPDQPPAPVPLVHEFPAFHVEPGQELLPYCQSWTLDNDQPLYVNAVEMSAGYAWHHSNWFFAPADAFPGDDGTWECDARGFDTIEVALVGGVLYAQSTQARAEAQQFRPGAAIVIPPHSVVIGQVHLLNAGDAAVDTSLSLTLRPLPVEQVDTLLTPLELHYFPLRLPAQRRSQFGAECDYAAAYGGPIEFSIHYVLPHYHALGEGMRLELFGGERDGEVVFESESEIGEPLGRTLDPPVPVAGADGLRFSCTFDNPRDEVVRWGVGDQEMCMALVFTDGPLSWAGGVESGRTTLPDDGDLARFGGECTLYSFAPRL